ncbi:sexual differentiation process protein isp4 [Coniochaeta hoffmannii]|uniref:Sexual differentiation process protein isp4 n=1 Tax=Coniochaeta hoffmannii TaxID=91930 RepID=A0AA38VEY9_9PEZI|nr:sexual differentiation process protein isp4 [Coniochaeta hoffmannii]
MPQDPNLYGQPAPKKQKKEMALSSSIDFTSQLTSLLSKPPPTHGRARPSKSKTDTLFSAAKVKRKPGARQPNADPDDNSNKITLKSPTTTSEEQATLAAARRKMEEKARLYAAMKRGDYVPGREGEAAPLVDFDRKWAEAHLREGNGSPAPSSSSGDDSSSEDDDEQEEETIEYEDEFGRLRTATRSQYLAHQRRLARGQHASAELETMSARPAAPSSIIYGEAVQTEAFTVADPEKMEELARKRDRSATPPPAAHYDAAAEIRNRGTGFYAFSKDEERRVLEMEGLRAERERTERVRREREDRLTKRRREVEERRREVAEKRAKKMADRFLEGLEVKWAAKEEGGETVGTVGDDEGGAGGGQAGSSD